MPIFSTPNRLRGFGLFFVALFLVTGLSSSMAVAQEEKAFSPAQEAALEDHMKSFIMDNPELIMMSVEKFQQEQMIEMEKKAQESIKKHRPFFDKNTDLPVAGNPDGDVTVVEFFDYNCGYCKKAFDGVLKLIEQDSNIRVVFMELPILSPRSETVARWALAANEQGKYFEFHKAVMNNKGALSESILEEEAKKLGLDIAKLKQDAASEKTDKMLEKVKSVAKDLGISGTPAFVVGDQPMRGYVPFSGLEAAVKEARKK